MSNTEKTDRDLVLAFIDGDEAAFNELYRRFQGRVRRLVDKYVPKYLRSERDDICQHFWTELFKYAHTYDHRRPVPSWLFSAAVKAVSSYARKQRSQSFRHPVDKTVTLRFDAGQSPPADTVGDPVAHAIRKEEAKVLSIAMTRVPRPFSKALRAIYLDGEEPLKYARRAGISRGTIYTQLKRGLTRLRTILTTKPASI